MHGPGLVQPCHDISSNSDFSGQFVLSLLAQICEFHVCKVAAPPLVLSLLSRLKEENRGVQYSLFSVSRYIVRR